MHPDTMMRIIHLYQSGMARRAIARKLGLNVKTVRRVLAPHSPLSVPRERPQGKLVPFLDKIAEKAAQGLTGSRILREIRQDGYTGGRTILLDHIRTLRGPAQANLRLFRRFETDPGQEAQVDWSPYRVQLAGRQVTVHCFSMILCHSRYLFIQFHRDERMHTLLSAHADAFAFFGGVTHRIVYDNMATVTLGRRGKTILWNPGFLPFAQHYAFQPLLCRPADPNRKGKVEGPFAYIEKDFLKGRAFDSWQHLESAASAWLKNVANRRRHGTTQLVPEEAYLSERDFLIALPETPFPTYRQEPRRVADDAVVSVDGTRYSVPVHLLGQSRVVTVRVHPGSIDILNSAGQCIKSCKKPDFPGSLVIDQEDYAAIRRKPRDGHAKTDHRFIDRFPGAERFLDGLKTRMKGLYGTHLREILDLALLYGDQAVAEALLRAGRYGNFNAYALRRILRERFPLIAPEIPDDRTLPKGAFHGDIDDVETGSFDDYRWNTKAGSAPDQDDTCHQDEKEELQ